MEKTLDEQCEYFRKELAERYGYSVRKVSQMQFAELRRLARHERNAALIKLMEGESK